MKKLYYLLLLSSLSNAQTWTLNYSTETVSEQIKSLSAPSDDVCWFVTNFDNLYKTNDGGTNWVKITPTSTSFNPSGLYVVNESTAFKSSIQQLFRTTDGGHNWTLVFTGVQSSPPVVQMKDENIGVVTSGGILYKTTNGGVSWSSASITQPPLSIQNTTGKGNVFNLGDELWVTQQSGGIAYSANFGSSWTTPSNTGLTSIGVNTRIAFATTNFGIATKGSVWPYIYVTNDGGNNWNNTDNSQGANEDVVADQANLWYIPNPADHFYIKNSINGGSSWQIQLQLEAGHGFNVLDKARSGHQLWAGTNKGKLYKYTPALSTDDFTFPKIYLYPNPTSEIVHFTSYDSNDVAIYNVFGCLVYSKKISYGNDNYLDISNLSNGVYIVIFTSVKNQHKSFKIIKQN